MNKEILLILAEECAEVIQAISKCERFGLDAYKPGKPKTNREHLGEELGDLLCMIRLIRELGVVSSDELEMASKAKLQKLKCWSNIDHKILDKDLV